MPNVGYVAKIGVRAVSVVTRDGKKHLIPNELLMTQAVENWSYSSRDVRVRMRVPVPYDCDLRLAQQLMVEAARTNPRILSDPEPVVWIIGFGERAVEHELRYWISDPEAGWAISRAACSSTYGTGSAKRESASPIRARTSASFRMATRRNRARSPLRLRRRPAWRARSPRR